MNLGWNMRAHHTFSWNSEEFESSYRSNSAGFRSEREFNADESRPKIVLVGDSFTFGTFVNSHETFGARIERALPQSVVYNLGMPGYGIDQMWMSVQHVALGLRPSLVIVSFIDEDFDRSLSAFRRGEGFNKPSFVLDAGMLRIRTPQDTPHWLIRARDEYSWIWSATLEARHAWARHHPYGDWWRLNAALLRAMERDLDRHGVRSLFIRLPIRNGFVPFPALRDFMATNRIDYLDLADPRGPLAGPPDTQP